MCSSDLRECARVGILMLTVAVAGRGRQNQPGGARARPQEIPAQRIHQRGCLPSSRGGTTTCSFFGQAWLRPEYCKLVLDLPTHYFERVGKDLAHIVSGWARRRVNYFENLRAVNGHWHTGWQSSLCKLEDKFSISTSLR